jgi:hypothetical protein
MNIRILIIFDIINTSYYFQYGYAFGLYMAILRASLKIQFHISVTVIQLFIDCLTLYMQKLDVVLKLSSCLCI